MSEQTNSRAPEVEVEAAPPAAGPPTEDQPGEPAADAPGTGEPAAPAAPPEAGAADMAGEAGAGDEDVSPGRPSHDPTAWYAGPAGPTLSFGFNLPKIPDQGEDADPIVRDGPDLGLVGVFDGMGGAGGTVYETPLGPRTGAYLASRIAREVVEERMLALLDPDWNLDGPAAARELQRAVRQALREALTDLNAPKSGLRSRLLRALPTTMALMALQRREPQAGRWAGHLLWAGDSRVYVFDPTHGARQLTVDDIRDAGDAMTNLAQDSVVSNAMSADTDFVVNHRRVELTAPFLAVAATDGCFGYLRSPMHFEHLLLSTLRDSAGTEGWSRALQAEITAVAGDDAAMAVLGVGAGHEQFRRLFARRTAEVERRCIAPMDELDQDIRRAEQAAADLHRRKAALQASLWGSYKPEY
ncbi:MAG TPA: protein phosphatase 2C domain-containing protein [Dermatophilaceae bacterium]|nr:protein phosphatase 2C domain-containing protein [Dermatophilaceae bacterium]